MHSFEIYRYDPDVDKAPRTSTYEIDMDEYVGKSSRTARTPSRTYDILTPYSTPPPPRPPPPHTFAPYF